MNKQILFFLLMLLPMVASADDSGACGDKVTWTYVETTGTLTISGTGEMYNYNYNGAPWYSYRSNIQAVIIDKGVTSIGNNVFRGCSGLTSVTIPNSVTSIGDAAFYDSGGLTSITIPNSVTSIGAYNFYYCTGLTSITIPNSVTSIGAYTFYYCSGLTSVTIGNSVTSIGDGAFTGCSNLTSILVENENRVYDSRNDCNAIIKTSENELILGCLNTVIPNSVTSIGAHSFEKCGSLTTVTIPNSVTSIGENAFWYCGLTSVTIPSSVKSIGDMAFSMCAGLTSVTIQNGLLNLGERAFFECVSLTTVTIPSSIKSIGNGAFSICMSLTDVYCYAEQVPATETNAFEYASIESATLHVPTASIEAYKNMEPWSRFGAIVELSPTPDPEKCSTPTIAYVKGEIVFGCETEDVVFVSEIKNTEVKKSYEGTIQLTPVVTTITVQATKEGYDDSDVAIATIEWREGRPVFTGFTSVTLDEQAIHDVNGDGEVGIGDIVSITNVMAGKE